MFSHSQQHRGCCEMHYNPARCLEMDIVGHGRQSYINLICCAGDAAWNELYIIYGFLQPILGRHGTWWNNTQSEETWKSYGTVAEEVADRWNQYADTTGPNDSGWARWDSERCWEQTSSSGRGFACKTSHLRPSNVQMHLDLHNGMRRNQSYGIRLGFQSDFRVQKIDMLKLDILRLRRIYAELHTVVPQCR